MRADRSVAPWRVPVLCLRESRPSVLVVFALRFGAGAALGAAGSWPSGALLGICSWTLAVFFVYLFNGVTDVVEDRANGSSRPIAGGLLSPGTAARVAGGAAVLSLCLGVLAGPLFAVLVAALLVLGHAYSAPPLLLKSRPSTSVAVAVSAALLTYAAGFVAAGGRLTEVTGTPLPQVALIMAAWMGLVGAPAKDLPDALGDAAAGRRSFLTAYGLARTRILLIAAPASLAVAAGLASMAEPLLAGMAIGLSAGAVVLAGLAVKVGAGSRVPYRVFMATQYIAHVAVLLSVLWA
ncbi:UbiA family prenyltransferase [Nonomuraea sp. NPDC049709]|uniref:UbiA family prenyltransferase n=1 Tax=Nonomuraea sp. NPDC049709 TaxID=3154736 RepID=UPI0034419A88